MYESTFLLRSFVLVIIVMGVGVLGEDYKCKGPVNALLCANGNCTVKCLGDNQQFNCKGKAPSCSGYGDCNSESIDVNGHKIKIVCKTGMCDINCTPASEVEEDECSDDDIQGIKDFLSAVLDIDKKYECEKWKRYRDTYIDGEILYLDDHCHEKAGLKMWIKNTLDKKCGTKPPVTQSNSCTDKAVDGIKETIEKAIDKDKNSECKKWKKDYNKFADGELSTIKETCPKKEDLKFWIKDKLDRECDTETDVKWRRKCSDDAVKAEKDLIRSLLDEDKDTECEKWKKDNDKYIDGEVSVFGDKCDKIEELKSWISATLDLECDDDTSSDADDKNHQQKHTSENLWMYFLLAGLLSLF